MSYRFDRTNIPNCASFVKCRKKDQLKDQMNTKVNDDVVWKRGNQYHNRQMVNGKKDNGKKDNGVDGSFVATKIKRKMSMAGGKIRLLILPENKFHCVKDESGWGKKKMKK